MTNAEAVERLRNLREATECRCVAEGMAEQFQSAREHAKDAEALRLAVAALEREKP